jgi:hypothetical protein
VDLFVLVEQGEPHYSGSPRIGRVRLPTQFVHEAEEPIDARLRKRP